MPINERGEFVRDRPSPPRNAQQPPSGPTQQGQGGGGGAGCLVVLFIIGLGIWGATQGSRPRQAPASSTASSAVRLADPYTPRPAPPSFTPPAPVPAPQPTPPPAPPPETPRIELQPIPISGAHDVRFSNECSQPVRLYTSYLRENGTEGSGYYDFEPNERAFLASGETRIKVQEGEMYYYARMGKPDRDYTWSGDTQRNVYGHWYAMKKVTGVDNQGVISIAVSCENFWRVQVRNSCTEEIQVAVAFNSLEPNVGMATESWWTFSPGKVATLRLSNERHVEVSSSGPSAPGEVFYFAKSKSYEWSEKDTSQGRLSNVDGTYVRMRRRELTVNSTGPHLNFQCRGTSQ